MRPFFVLLSLVLFASCLQNSKTEKAADTPAHSGPAFNTAKTIDTGFLHIDSAEFYFYKDVENGDPERYVRYFTTAGTSRQEQLSLLSAALDSPFTAQPYRKACRSYGKIYLFRQGDIKQTVYFGLKKPDCHYLDFIFEGEHYYGKLPPELESMLQALKTEATEK